MINVRLFVYTAITMGKIDSAALLDGKEEVNAIPNATAEAIQAMILGPLRGKEVTLLTEEDDSDGKFIANTVTSSLKYEPIIVQRLPKRLTIPDGEFLNVREAKAFNNTDQEDIFFREFNAKSVMVIVNSGDVHWKPFYNFGEKLAKNIVLISLSTSCQIKTFFETPLLSKTTFVALICPRKVKEGSKVSTSFRMYCWRPYASGNQAVDLGIWNPESFKAMDHLFIDRFNDMSKKYMAILGMPEDVPFFYNETDGTVTGVTHTIVQECAFALKFNLNINASREFVWDDMLQRVKTGESDLFINYAPMTPERYRDFDLLVPYYQEGYGLMLHIPPPLPRSMNIIYPFSWMVWTAVAVSMASTSVTYHIIYYEHEKSFPNNALSVLQCMLSNAMKFIPKPWHVRIFLLIWWIVSWLLQASYTSNLIAVLTVPVFPKNLETTQELADSYHRLCMVDYGEFVPEALRTSSQPVLARLGRVLDMVPMNFSLNFAGQEYCGERVMRDTHAHIGGISYLKFLYNGLGHGSKTYLLKEKLYLGYIVLLTTKNSPWSYKISRIVRRMVEAGLVKKWHADTMATFTDLREGDSSNHRRQELQALTMDHLQGSFYLLLGGIILSVVALMWEFVTVPKLWWSLS